MTPILISLVVALAVVAALTCISQLSVQTSPWDSDGKRLKDQVACPNCQHVYSARDIEMRHGGFAGANTVAAVTCSSCHMTAEFGLHDSSLVFEHFAAEDLLCLQCDNWYHGRPNEICPHCGSPRIVSAVLDPGTFNYRPIHGSKNLK
jgi:ssDNA-binding Zn-finger/Zn-ribbon topoisomerase 1